MAAAFQSNPLSLSYRAEDVAEYVKEERAEAERARRASEREASSRGGKNNNGRGGGVTPPPESYKLPYLTVGDLKKPPVEWREFLCTDHLARSYAFPRSLRELRRRVDGNVYAHVGNYVLAVFATFCVVLYQRPKALFGALFATKVWDWVGASAGVDHVSSRAAAMHQFKAGVATILSWAVMTYTRAAGAISNAIVLSVLVVVCHAAMRRLDPPPPDWRRSPRRPRGSLGTWRGRGGKE